MKTLYHKLTVLIFITFLLPSLGGVKGGLYAQDPEIFNHTWYFSHGELDGDVFLPTENLTADLYFYPNDLLAGYTYCEGGISFDGVVFDIAAPTFEIMGEYLILMDQCYYPTHEDEMEFMGKHNNFYLKDGQTFLYFNPFTYSIVPISDYYQLTIENSEGDWAVYTSKLMSNPSFNQTNIALHPNPVNETLYINNTFNKVVQANIYDLNGKLLHSYTIESQNVTIDVKSFNQGVYFMVFENETGEWISKKFIKK